MFSLKLSISFAPPTERPIVLHEIVFQELFPKEDESTLNLTASGAMTA